MHKIKRITEEQLQSYTDKYPNLKIYVSYDELSNEKKESLKKIKRKEVEKIIEKNLN